MANRTRSAVWEFFSKTGNANLATCHICCSTLAYSGTTNLLKHLRAKHSDEASQVVQLSTDDSEDRTETDLAVKTMKQTSSEELTEGDGSVAMVSPGQRSGRKNRSLAWSCFRKIVGSNVAECLFCGAQLVQENGTTTCLIKHFMGKHPDVYAMHVESHQESVCLTLSGLNLFVSCTVHNENVLWVFSVDQGQDYHIGTSRKMSVDIDATPDLLLLIQQKLHRY